MPTPSLKIRTVNRRSIKCRANRRGSSAVSFAICAPIMVLVVMGSIEITNLIFLKQALTASAYEAARVAIQDEKGRTESRVRAAEVLTARGVENYSIRFEPQDIINLPRGTPLTVTIEAPAAENSVGPMKFTRTVLIQAAVSMVKE